MYGAGERERHCQRNRERRRGGREPRRSCSGPLWPAHERYFAAASLARFSSMYFLNTVHEVSLGRGSSSGGGLR